MSITQLKDNFRRLKIDFSSPGFYNDKKFIDEERTNNLFLEDYAFYIEKKTYEAKYLAEAESNICKIARLFSNEIKIAGLLGQCVDSAMILSLILERAGFWNYIVKGSVTIKCPERYGYPLTYFHSCDVNQFTAAHVWIVAPPFSIIDVAIKLQPYKRIDAEIIPDFICTSEFVPANAMISDLVSDELISFLKYKGDRIEDFIPDYRNFSKKFAPIKVTSNEIEFKYIPVGIAAPSESLENNTYKINGLSANEISDKIISKLVE